MPAITSERPVASPLGPAPPEPLWRFSVDQYREMVEKGIVGEDDPVELLDGLLVAKMGKNPAHVICAALCMRLLAAKVPASWFLLAQDPVSLPPSEPEPDFAVVRGDPRTAGIPTGEDIGLVIEIADSSLARDRGWKQAIYAGAGIPAYWILNLADGRLEVYTEPRGDAYAACRVLGPEDEVPLVLDGVEAARLPVGALLP
jgi:Uma2 family endonuclease